MKRALELMTALANGPAPPEAALWARSLRQTTAATPEVAAVVARAPPVSAGASVAARIITIAVVAGLAAVTAKAIALMSPPPEPALIPWWIPFVVVTPTLGIVVASLLSIQRKLRRAALDAGHRLADELQRHDVTRTLAVEAAVYVYQLDESARKALEEGSAEVVAAPPTASTDGRRVGGRSMWVVFVVFLVGAVVLLLLTYKGLAPYAPTRPDAATLK